MKKYFEVNTPCHFSSSRLVFGSGDSHNWFMANNLKIKKTKRVIKNPR